MRAVPDHRADEIAISEFFDWQYAAHRRYWWRGDNRYSLDPADHTAYNAVILQFAVSTTGRALDLGAGEGADAIRLAKLGWQVEAVELSPVACEKIEDFASREHVEVLVRNESMTTAVLAEAAYDLVLMNGSLHYIEDKALMLAKARRASTKGAVHAVSLFSTATPMPHEHTVVPVFPDDEDGIVEDFYRDDSRLLRVFDRNRQERSHPGFGVHQHSHIKLITELNSADQL